MSLYKCRRGHDSYLGRRNYQGIGPSFERSVIIELEGWQLGAAERTVEVRFRYSFKAATFLAVTTYTPNGARRRSNPAKPGL